VHSLSVVSMRASCGENSQIASSASLLEEKGGASPRAFLETGSGSSYSLQVIGGDFARAAGVGALVSCGWLLPGDFRAQADMRPPMFCAQLTIGVTLYLPP
jgi:hypothetical protein